MLISKIVKIKWNSKIYKHYINLGYKYTKMGDEFEVKIEDLTRGSSALIECKCDYCNNNYKLQYQKYVLLKKKKNKKDCCGNPKCTGKKSKESIKMLYNVDNMRQIEDFNKKIEATNIKKYGCSNPFGNKEIQEKIRKTNIEKYGYPIATQNPEIRNKGIDTCLKKYGVINYGIIYSKEHTGELSSSWKGGNRKTKRIERESPEYREWRKNVFGRDFYTCQNCGRRNGNGKYIELHAHHLNNFKNYINERYDLNNGVTLCVDCHQLFHSMYGIKNVKKEQFYEFLKNNANKNIC